MDTLIRNPAEVEIAFRLTIAKYPQQACMPVPMPTSDNVGGFVKLAQIAVGSSLDPSAKVCYLSRAAA